MHSSICSVVVAEPLTAAKPLTAAEPLTVAEPVTVAEPLTVLDALEHILSHAQCDEDDGQLIQLLISGIARSAL